MTQILDPIQQATAALLDRVVELGRLVDSARVFTTGEINYRSRHKLGAAPERPILARAMNDRWDPLDPQARRPVQRNAWWPAGRNRLLARPA